MAGVDGTSLPGLDPTKDVSPPTMASAALRPSSQNVFLAASDLVHRRVGRERCATPDGVMSSKRETSSQFPPYLQAGNPTRTRRMTSGRSTRPDRSARQSVER